MKGEVYINQDNYSFFASAAFGLEGLVAKELNKLGINAKAETGGARFEGTLLDAYKANIQLRTADRVLMILDEGEARTFEALFQLVGKIQWEKYLTREAMIHVSGKCVRSQLMSVRDCQAITKKAIVSRLQSVWRTQRLPENGARFPIEIAIVKDVARVTLNLSGDALNRRGYRTWNGEAPLRETLAAAMLDICVWHPERPLYDPCCGTGTLMVEAAIKAMKRPAGIYRTFACEEFKFMPLEEMKKYKEETLKAIDHEYKFDIGGSDIDPAALDLCYKNISQAGLENYIQPTLMDLRQLQLDSPKGLFILNPPYGERLSDQKQARELYKEIGALYRRHPGWQLVALTSDPAFERYFGQRATRKRRLYNGRLECELFIYTR